MPTTPARRSPVRLTVSSPSEVTEPTARIPHVAWLTAALAWSGGVAVLGLAAIAVPVIAAGLTAERATGVAVVDTVVQFWVAAHGVDAIVGGVVVGVTPLGVTAILLAACAAVAHHAAVQAGGDERDTRTLWRTWAAVVGVCAGTYTGVSLILALALAHPGQAVPLAGGAAMVAVCGAALGALVGTGLKPLANRSWWIQRLPKALAAGFGVLVVGAMLALGVSLWAHGDQVAMLHQALAPDTLGTVLLICLQLAYLPNVVAWVGSWALGATVSLGPGTGISPGVTAVGAMPTLPIFGLLPANGETWAWVWMLLGTAAGAVAAIVLFRGLPASSVGDLEGWPWQAGIAGVLVGLGWSALAWVSRGDLGVDRLVGLGPRFPDLLWLSVMGIGLAAAATGIIAFTLAQRRLPKTPDDEDESPVLTAVGADTPQG